MTEGPRGGVILSPSFPLSHRSPKRPTTNKRSKSSVCQLGGWKCVVSSGCPYVPLPVLVVPHGSFPLLVTPTDRSDTIPDCFPWTVLGGSPLTPQIGMKE